MELDGQFFSVGFLWVAGFIVAGLVALAVYLSPWYRLKDREQLHVFLGSSVLMMIMWTMRTEVYIGVDFHLIFVTTLTLMFGWSLAILAGVLVVLGVSVAGIASWSGFPLNVLTTVIVPISFTQLSLLLIRHWFPRHFFVFIYLNAFLTGGLSLMLSSFFASFLLALATPVAFSVLWDTYLTYFPLMFFPEAVMNGWLVTLLVGYRPHWISSFRDVDYLQGK